MTTETTMPFKPVTFTADELAVLQRAAQAVWDFLAPDCVPATPAEAALSRKDVIARVVASGRLEHAVRRQPHPASLLVKFRVTDDDTLTSALQGAFPLARYTR